MYTTPRKRSHNDENAGVCTPTPKARPISFRTPLQPTATNTKTAESPRLSPMGVLLMAIHLFLNVAVQLSRSPPAEITRVRDQMKDAHGEARAIREAEKAKEKEREQAQADQQIVAQCVSDIRRRGITLHGFLEMLFHSTDRVISSQVTQALVHCTPSVLDGIAARQPDIFQDWQLTSMREKIDQEGEALATAFRPSLGSSVTQILEGFSLQRFLADIKSIAPTIYELLRQIGFPGHASRADLKAQKSDLVSL